MAHWGKIPAFFLQMDSKSVSVVLYSFTLEMMKNLLQKYSIVHRGNLNRTNNFSFYHAEHNYSSYITHVLVILITTSYKGKINSKYCKCSRPCPSPVIGRTENNFSLQKPYCSYLRKLSLTIVPSSFWCWKFQYSISNWETKFSSVQYFYPKTKSNIHCITFNNWPNSEVYSCIYF